MITCDLIGQAGNQMFEIATTVAHALDMGTNYAFPESSKGTYDGGTYFKELPKLSGGNFQRWTEPSHRYHPIPKIKNLKLHGYFQSAKYFQHRRKEIQDLFKLNSFMQIDRMCSVHIRLGDYKKFKDKHPPVTVEYLNHAMQHINNERHGACAFIIFSDEPREALSMIESTDFYKQDDFKKRFSLSKQTDPINAMREMLWAQDHIISNSTFSWWPAWLNNRDDKIVIAPKVWFGPGNSHLETKDIYCENWIKI